LSITEEVNAKKAPILAEEAIRLARQSSEIVAAMGKKTVRVNLKKDKPTDDDLFTLRIGKKMIVGFLEEMYAGELG
jgi:hypothetical protein